LPKRLFDITKRWKEDNQELLQFIKTSGLTAGDVFVPVKFKWILFAATNDLPTIIVDRKRPQFTFLVLQFLDDRIFGSVTVRKPGYALRNAPLLHKSLFVVLASEGSELDSDYDLFWFGGIEPRTEIIEFEPTKC